MSLSHHKISYMCTHIHTDREKEDQKERQFPIIEKIEDVSSFSRVIISDTELLF